MISALWQEILETIETPSDGVLVEAGPGFKPKVAKAVAALGFSGDYYVVEPNKAAIEHTAPIYRALMPHARVHAINTSLNTALAGAMVPVPVDGFFANHLLDDMFLSITMGSDEADNFFSLDSGPQRDHRLEEIWSDMNPRTVEDAVLRTAEALIAGINALNPRVLILSHYQSKTQLRKGILAPTTIGREVIGIVKKQLGLLAEKSFTEMTASAGFGEDWIIADLHKSGKGTVKNVPARCLEPEPKNTFENEGYSAVLN